MNIKKTIFVSFMAILSLSRVAHAYQVITCDANEYALAYTQVQQTYNSEISQFQKKLEAINCLDKSPICDQIKLVALISEYQHKINKLTASYVEQDRLSLCYDIKSSTALSMESGFNILAIKPASTSTSNADNSKQLTKSQPSDAGDWIQTYSTYTAGCMNTQSAVSACGSLGKTLVACRPGEIVEEIDFFSNNRDAKKITKTEVKCGGASPQGSLCSGVYYHEGSAAPVCNYSEAEWSNLRSCFAADKIQERASTCSKGCQTQPNYHVCDWTDEEWKTYGNCATLMAQLTREKSCPNSNPDVDEDGPAPRMSLTGFRVQGAAYNTFLVSPSNNLSFSFSSVKGNSGSYCVKTIGTNTCDSQSNYSSMNLSHSRSSGRVDLTHNELSPGAYTFIALNDVTGKTTSVDFTVVSADMAFPCVAGKWIENRDMEFGPFAKTGTNPSSFYEGKNCDCAKNPEEKDSSNRRWQCTASSAPSATKISGVENNCIGDKGSFCNEAANLVTEWVQHTCEGKPAGTGWVDQDNNIYHRFTTLTCGVAKPPAAPVAPAVVKSVAAACKVINGEFCGGTHMTEWVNNTCGVVPAGGGWMDQGNNIWHKGTTRLCAK